MRKYLYLTVLACTLTGCATVTPPVPPAITPPAGMKGTFHKVARKETLWRISKNYHVDLDELVKINHISDAASIEIGQLIFIPERPAPQKSADNTFGNKGYTYSQDFIWPLKGKIVTGYGKTVANMVNKGLNIQPQRSEEVVASRGGQVVFYSDNFLNFGKTIIIDHHDGFSTLYARNAVVFVKTGDEVARGAAIAKAGAAGRDNNTYLHFEIRKGSIAQNPLFYLPN